MNVNLKKSLSSGTPCIGSWITVSHPAIAEIMARAGFDFLVVDLEHSPIGIHEAEQLIRTIDLSGVTPLVRLTSNDTNLIKRVMDSGAKGIIVPMVNSVEDVKNAINALYYPPKGKRGVGLARAQGYGTSFQEYKKQSLEESILVVMIEDVAAIPNLEEIFSFEEVDAFLLGPYDLSSSMGKAGQFDDPEVEANIQLIKDTAKKMNIPAGIHVVEPNPDHLKQRIKDGFTFIPYSLDTRMLDTSCRLGLKSIKE